MSTEEENRNELERWLAPAFHTYREVCIRHALFTRRTLRVYVTSAYKERPLVLTVGNEVWVSSRGWRTDARNILAGKRQLGSQRFNILDELKGIS